MIKPWREIGVMQNFVAVKENGAELELSHTPVPVTHIQNARAYLQLRAKNQFFDMNVLS